MKTTNSYTYTHTVFSDLVGYKAQNHQIFEPRGLFTCRSQLMVLIVHKISQTCNLIGVHRKLHMHRYIISSIYIKAIAQPYILQNKHLDQSSGNQTKNRTLESEQNIK